MEYAIVAMRKTLLFYLIFVVGILLVIGLCIITSKSGHSKRVSTHMYITAISAVLIIYILSSFVPFLKDFFGNGIVEQRGIYTNIIGDDSKSASGVLGIYSVTLENEDQRINLTTVPFQEEVFIQGIYEVKAYFTSFSKRLLYIEVIGKADN